MAEENIQTELETRKRTQGERREITLAIYSIYTTHHPSPWMNI
jgi:hypothetical protein